MWRLQGDCSRVTTGPAEANRRSLTWPAVMDECQVGWKTLTRFSCNETNKWMSIAWIQCQLSGTQSLTDRSKWNVKHIKRALLGHRVATGNLVVPRRAFSVAAPRAWNRLYIYRQNHGGWHHHSPVSPTEDSLTHTQHSKAAVRYSGAFRCPSPQLP